MSYNDSFYDDYPEYKPKLSEQIIASLFCARSNYLRKKILWDLVQKRVAISHGVFNQNIYRLKKKGIIRDSKDGYVLLEKGISQYKDLYQYIEAKPKKTKRIIVLFDIPEPKKKVREWLRTQIKLWEFSMIQRSVWLGTGPLPSEFNERLRMFGVEKSVKVFNVQKKGDL